MHLSHLFYAMNENIQLIIFGINAQPGLCGSLYLA